MTSKCAKLNPKVIDQCRLLGSMYKDMLYSSFYSSPMGGLFLFSDGLNLTGLYFDNEYAIHNNINATERSNLQVFKKTKLWLDSYFSGKNPKVDIPLKFNGSNFRSIVWNALMDIPYGTTKTYGEIAKHVATAVGKNKMSAQAVGGAVGANPISIIIPCHRVIGANGNLVGYGAGIDKKIELLKLEGIIEK